MATTSRLRTVDDLASIRFPLHARADGALVVMERSGLPFAVERIFYVRAAEQALRGQHAHKRCNQLMVCVHGSIEVTCDDGEKSRTVLLDSMDAGLLVPASIWASELYREPQSVLMVACDRAYEEDDYIRDYDAFRRYRGLSADGRKMP